MIESGSGVSFVLKTAQPALILNEIGVIILERTLRRSRGGLRQVNFAQCPGAEHGNDLVRAQLGTGGNQFVPAGCDHLVGRIADSFLQDSRAMSGGSKEAFDFLPQRGIVAPLLSREIRARLWRQLRAS